MNRFFSLSLIALFGCPVAETQTEPPAEAQEAELRPFRLASDADIEAAYYGASMMMLSVATYPLGLAEMDALWSREDDNACPSIVLTDIATVTVTGGCTSPVTGIAYIGSFSEARYGTAAATLAKEQASGDGELEPAPNPYLDFEGFEMAVGEAGAIGVDGFLEFVPGEGEDYTVGLDLSVTVRQMPAVRTVGDVECTPRDGCDISTIRYEVERIGEVEMWIDTTFSEVRIQGSDDAVTLSDAGNGKILAEFDDGSSRELTFNRTMDTLSAFADAASEGAAAYDAGETTVPVDEDSAE